jgi:hypothetical protein
MQQLICQYAVRKIIFVTTVAVVVTIHPCNRKWHNQKNILSDPISNRIKIKCFTNRSSYNQADNCFNNRIETRRQEEKADDTVSAQSRGNRLNLLCLIEEYNQ